MLDFSSSLWFLSLQWIYTFFQAVRNTKGFNLCYYTVQWLILCFLSPAKSRRKKILWVNPNHKSRDFIFRFKHADSSRVIEDLLTHKIQIHGFQFLEYKSHWLKVQYRGKYYWVCMDVILELCSYNLQECYFVKDLIEVNTNYSVAQRISEEEAMLMMFSRDMHLCDVENVNVLMQPDELYNIEADLSSTDEEEDGGNARDSYDQDFEDENVLKRRTVIHGTEFNIEFNSKLGGFLAAIPIILQARQMNAISAIASLILLGVDFLRTPIYSAYDKGFFHTSKAVKLHVFGKRTWLYNAFGLVSDRWKYTDVKKGYSYLTKQGDEFEVASYVSFLDSGDCEIVGEKMMLNPGDTSVNPLMEMYTIVDGVISWAGLAYRGTGGVFKVRGGFYVCVQGERRLLCNVNYITT